MSGPWARARARCPLLTYRSPDHVKDIFFSRLGVMESAMSVLKFGQTEYLRLLQWAIDEYNLERTVLPLVLVMWDMALEKITHICEIQGRIKG